MHSTHSAHPRSGITLIELLVAIASLCILVVVLLPALGTTSRKAPVTACANNLKQIALGQLLWVNDHPSTNYPASDAIYGRLVASGDIVSYYKALSNELLSPKILSCPSDSRRPVDDFRSLTTNHLSYFLNLDAMRAFDPSTALNGDRHLSFTPPRHGQTVTLNTNVSMQWTKGLGHRVSGNISFLDGSVQRTLNRDLATALLSPSNKLPRRLLFP